MKVAIVDDMAIDRRNISRDVWAFLRREGLEDKSTVDLFSDGICFLKKIQNGDRYDIVFLDICMETRDGIAIADGIRDISRDCPIVFVTGAPEFGLDAYPVHPFDFLTKPYQIERFERMMSDFLLTFGRKEKEIEVRIPHGTLLLPPGKIVSVTSSAHQMIIRMEDGSSVLSNSTFAELRTLFSEFPQFLEINRGVLINMDFAKNIFDGFVVMLNEERFPLRIRNQSELLRAFTQHQVRNRMRQQ